MLADEPMALGKPKADRLLDGKNRSIWKLPCTKGTNLLVLCDSQAKRVQKMRLKLYKFNKVGHYVADDTLVINVCYGEVGNYGDGDTQTQSTQKSSQSQPWKESTIKLL